MTSDVQEADVGGVGLDEVLAASTSSPISTEKTRRRWRLLHAHLQQVRFCGSMVSPQLVPVHLAEALQALELLLVGFSAWNCAWRRIVLQVDLLLPTTVEYSGGWPM